MKINKTAIFLLCFFLVLSTAFMIYFKKVSSQNKVSALPIVGADQNHHIAPFSFVNQDGKTITNADVKGKICVVEYFFTTCTSICPKMNEHMEQVYKAFRGNDKVLILSHTVDPLKDSIQVLKSYSLRFDADASQWMFLTGDKKQLYEMGRYSYLINSDADTVGVSVADDFLHDNHYALVDGDGHVRGFYDGLKDAEVAKLIGDIKTLLSESSEEGK